MATPADSFEDAADAPVDSDSSGSIGSDLADDMAWVQKGLKWFRANKDKAKTDVSANKQKSKTDVFGDNTNSINKGIELSPEISERKDRTLQNYQSDQRRLNEGGTAGSQGRRPIIHVGIYLGATRSGSAFRVKGEGELSSIQMNRTWVTEYGIQTSTVPTVILTDSAKSALFGIEAVTKFAAVEDPGQYLFQEATKIKFRKSAADKADPEATPFLKYILESLRENVKQQLNIHQLWCKEYSQDIRWTITCDNGMVNDLSRELIEQVFESQYVKMIPEDEAAALWCSEIPIFELTDAQHPSMEIGVNFGVLDIDHAYLSFFKKMGTMGVRKLQTQQLKTDFNNEYEKLLSNVFNTRTGGNIEDYKTDYQRDWLKILKVIETQMKKANSNQEMRVILTLPHTFIEYFKNVSRFESQSVSLITKEKKLIIKQDFFRQIFNTYAQQVLFYLSGLSTLNDLQISYLFLIGKSWLLEKTIERLVKEPTFSNVNIKWIKEPEDSDACALRGAVLVESEPFDVNM